MSSSKRDKDRELVDRVIKIGSKLKAIELEVYKLLTENEEAKKLIKGNGIVIDLLEAEYIKLKGEKK